ncbi:exodeoxyribonuclease VII small subunit [Thalassotalea eurytherma]|uniref:Exodeoxyribonuclease 7 small subunit n=1 Tax=Thalassotalea eurytherma TaxID=1144278 RepID=A0ABQ6H4W4_9GAMM|nr:exodeoxyribonuclease VII small subunit [Thalassotalea eurytherma]GLX82549.1 exodeoxyribonuclease 7 small subunit [Thalassotalea eurytherma]
MAKKKIENLSFEESINELNDIVEQLETGELSLEASMELFERGLKLSKSSQTKLSAAEQKINVLIQEHEQQPVPFDFQPSDV